MEKYKVWTDNESKVYTSKDFENINDACEYASKFVHEHDAKPYRVICHIDDENGETVDTYENIADYNFEFEDYKRDHIAFRMNQAMSGYYRLEMYEPNTKPEIHNSIRLIDDPANEDYYDYDLARESFDEYLEENFPNRTLNIISRAVDEFNYQLSDAPRDCGMYDIEGMECECEDLIFDDVEDDYEYCELHQSGCSQYYNYYDGDYTKTCSGEIWNYDMHEVFYTEKDNGVLDFEHPLKGYELESGNAYAFIYDKVINSEGKVIGLYDFYEE